jgi:3',5'-cyclic AMP phosphodiesterase CpdA
MTMRTNILHGPRGLAVAVAGLGLAGAMGCAGAYYGTEGALAGPMAPGDSLVVLAAGDIADCRTPGDEQTSAMLDTIPGMVLALGDNAYVDGTEREYRDCYAPTWGRHRARTWPAPGNHDYNTPGAAAYYAYYGDRAGAPETGYYSFDAGGWHFVMMNTSVPMGPGSAQGAVAAGGPGDGAGARNAVAVVQSAATSEGGRTSMGAPALVRGDFPSAPGGRRHRRARP